MADHVGSTRKRKHEELDDGDYVEREKFAMEKFLQFNSFHGECILVHEDLLKRHAKLWNRAHNPQKNFLKSLGFSQMKTYARYLYNGRRNLMGIVRQESKRPIAMLSHSLFVSNAWQYGLIVGDIGYMNACMSSLFTLKHNWATFALNLDPALAGTAIHRWYVDGKTSALTERNIELMRGKNIPSDKLVDILAKVFKARQEGEELALPTLQDEEKYHVDDSILEHPARLELQRKFGL